MAGEVKRDGTEICIVRDGYVCLLEEKGRKLQSFLKISDD